MAEKCLVSMKPLVNKTVSIQIVYTNSFQALYFANTFMAFRLKNMLRTRFVMLALSKASEPLNK